MSYAGDDDDSDDDDLLFFALVAAGAYIVLRLWRSGYTLASVEDSFIAPASGANVLSPMQLSPGGAAFIKGQEGFRATSYADGPARSIGYGHQIVAGDNIQEPISQAEAEALFQADAGRAAAAVAGALLVPVTQGQFDAMVDLAYQEGVGAFLGSTLLQKINGGDYDGAAQEFNRWIYAGGQVSPAIQARRQSDISMFYS